MKNLLSFNLQTVSAYLDNGTKAFPHNNERLQSRNIHWAIRGLKLYESFSNIDKAPGIANTAFTNSLNEQLAASDTSISDSRRAARLDYLEPAVELTELMSAFCMQHFLIGKVIPNNLGHAVGSLVVMPPSLNHFLVQNCRWIKSMAQ